jgi:hypothetical protein
MKMIYITLALSILVCANTLVNNCAPECGGSTEFDCSDFRAAESSPEKCYSCASGYIGGSGRVDGTGALCYIGICDPACAACKTRETRDECYLCSYGFYDSVGDRRIATPCKPCHPTCLSCSGPRADQCRFCAIGYFDSLNNPYSDGTCDVCDSSLSMCSVLASNDNGRGCCALGYTKESLFSTKCKINFTCTN